MQRWMQEEQHFDVITIKLIYKLHARAAKRETLSLYTRIQIKPKLLDSKIRHYSG